jgi:hypothetical protein
MVLGTLMTGCRPCNPIIIDRGQIPAGLLEKIPYHDGEYVHFRHSNGLLISFFVERHTEKRRECLEKFYGCCDELIFEENITVLSPDYPIFNFELSISNADTIANHIWGRIGRNNFMIPDEQFAEDYPEVADSMLINGILYRKVYKIKFREAYGVDEILSADSLMYSTEYGILKVVMTNGEQYLRDE